MTDLEYLDQWLNFYECPTCGHQFYDVWDCQVNMICTACDEKALEPKHSWELPVGGIDSLCVWDGYFQPLDDDP